MGPHLVVVALPSRQNRARMTQRREHRLVETLIAQPPVEAFDKRILCRLARRDVMPGNPALLRPAQDCRARQLRPLSLTTLAGKPRRAQILSNSRATRAPLNEVSAASPRHSRV
jgi:hypothetical protein